MRFTELDIESQKLLMLNLNALSTAVTLLEESTKVSNDFWMNRVKEFARLATDNMSEDEIKDIMHHLDKAVERNERCR